MAGTISFSGISASGIDTSAWVDALVSVKQQTITTLQEQQEAQEKLLSVVNEIKTFFTSFQSCLSKITDSQFGIPSMDLFLQNLAISSNTNIATATATTEAARQSYDVLVDELATATRATSGRTIYEEVFATLDTKLGLLGVTNGTITVNSQAFSITTENTIRDLISKFKEVGVTSSFDEEKGTFTVSVGLNEIDEGATNIKSALKLQDNSIGGAVSGSLVYVTRDTEFSKLKLTAGKVMIEGEEHTITQNGNNYSISKAGGAVADLNTVGDFFDYLMSSEVGAEDARVDGIGNITIKGATLDKVEGGSNILDVLNLTETQNRIVMESGKLTYSQNHIADLTTKLSDLGINNDTELIVAGNTNNITSDMTLGDVKNIMNAGGVDFDIDKTGVITVDTKGNEISGSLLDALGLDPSKGGTTITSSPHTARFDADGNTLLSDLGIDDSMEFTAYKSDGTAISAAISGLSNKTVDEFITDLKALGLDASFDSVNHQIKIDDGYIDGTVADVLGMSSQTTTYTEAATLNTTLDKFGATGVQTLVIDGGTTKTYSKDTTLNTVLNDIIDAGAEVSFKNGNLEIKGVTLGGTLPALLGLDAITSGSSVTSGALTVTTGSSSSGGNMTETVENDISLDSKIGDILGTTIDYTLKVDNGNTVTYTKNTTLATLKNQIEAAGGVFKINDDNTITIDGVTMSGTLVGALGFDSVDNGTKFSTINPVMVSGTSNVATGGTTLGGLGIVQTTTRALPTNMTLKINGGQEIVYDASTTLNDIFADIIAAGGTAKIDSEGYLEIDGVHLEGTLVDALGLRATSNKTTITSGNLEVTTSTTSTSSSTLYGQEGGDINWNTTIASITGNNNSYSLTINGNNKSYASNTKLSDIKTAIEAAGGTMNINSDNTIDIQGVALSGTLFDVLGFVVTDYKTVISSNNPIYAKGEDVEADETTKFNDLGISTDLREYSIYANDGSLIKVTSSAGASGDSTIGDWLTTLNNALNAANGTSGQKYATINEGIISITGGYVTGALATALDIRTETVVTDVTMTGNSVSYLEYKPLSYIGTKEIGEGDSGKDVSHNGSISNSITQGGTASENTVSNGSIGVNGSQGGNAEGDMSSIGWVGSTSNQTGTASSDINSSGLIGPEDEFVDLFGNITDATLNATLSELLKPNSSDPLNNDARLPADSYTLKIGNYATKTFNSDTTKLSDVISYIENLKTYDPTYDMAFDAYLSGDKLVIKSDAAITGTLADVLGLTKVNTEDEYYTYVAKSVKYTDLVEGGSNGYNFSVVGTQVEYEKDVLEGENSYEYEGVMYTEQVRTVVQGAPSRSAKLVDLFGNDVIGKTVIVSEIQGPCGGRNDVGEPDFGIGGGTRPGIELPSRPTIDDITHCGPGQSSTKTYTIDANTTISNLCSWSAFGTLVTYDSDTGELIVEAGMYDGCCGGTISGTFYNGFLEGELEFFGTIRDGYSGTRTTFQMPDTEIDTTVQSYAKTTSTISSLFEGSTSSRTLTINDGSGDVDLTFSSSDTVQTIINKLATYGITAKVIEPTGLSLESQFFVESDKCWTFSGELAKALFGESSSTVKQYSGSTLSYTKTSYQEIIYDSSTKLSSIDSYVVGKRIWVVSDTFEGDPTSIIANSMECSFIHINNNTTIDDVIEFLKFSFGVSNVSYDTNTGKITFTVRAGRDVSSNAYGVLKPYIESDGSTSGGTYSIDIGSSIKQVTTTNTANVDTTMKDIFDSFSSQSFSVTVNGSTSTISLSSSDTVSSLLVKLENVGLSATFDNNKLVVSGSNFSIENNSVTKKLFGGYFPTQSTVGEGAYIMDQVSTMVWVTKTFTLDASTVIGDLFGDSNNHTFTVNGENITLGSSNTIQDLIDKLADKGVIATVTDGEFLIGSNGYGLSISGDLANKILGKSGSSSVTVDYDTQEVTLSTSSRMEDIFWDGDNHTFVINKTGGGSTTITLGKNDTIQTLIDKLRQNGIAATIDSSGKMTFKSNYKWTASGDLANLVTGGSTMSMTTTNLYTYETEELEVYTGHQTVSQMLNAGKTLISGFRYHIASAADLKALATFVNQKGLNTSNIDFILDGNITLDSSFVSIGTSSNAFKGNFYGNGNTISGATKTIFANASGGEIRDVAVLNANISGGDNSGILVGKGSSLKITNAYVTGSISGGSNTGALAGSLTSSTVKESYSTATVSGSSNVGGLVGTTTSTNISKSYATGDVTGTGSKVGGLAGSHVSGTITAAYATGNVKGNSTVGGFVGANSGTISNSYSTSRVYGTTRGAFAGSNSGTFTGNVYNSNLEIAGVGSGSSSGLTAKTFVEMQNQSIMQGLGFTADKGWKYTQYNTPYLGNIAVEENGGSRLVSNVDELRAGDTYYISSKDDLIALATFVNGGADTTGVTFILNNDVDMSGVNFTSIGTISNTFRGDFYGNGYTIKNLNISTTSANVGLFGVIEDSHIQDVAIHGVTVSGGSNTGALVGSATGASTIKNSYAKGGNVSGSGNNLGGLVGSLGSEAKLEESYTSLMVSANSSISNVGGLVGSNEGTVTKGYTDGEVKAANATNVGGLIGTNSGKVSTSYVMRNVTGANNVGGFIGTNSGNVSNSYSIADVLGSTSGGFIGKNNGGSLSGNVYNIGSGDAIVNAQGVGSGSSTGISGLVIEDMRKQSVMQALGFTAANGWKYLNYVTPVLGGVTTTGGGKIYVDNSLTEFEIGDTYYINSAAQLKRLAEMVNAGHDTAGIVFVLENDITLDSSFTSIGTSSEMFKGDFYGNGHTISGAQDTIFGYTSNAKIQDVGVINANVSGGNNTGILVGYGEHNTEIINSYVNGSVSGSNNVGGLAGTLVDSTVTNSFSNAIVNGASTVGGLLGKITNTTVKTSYATGDVTASGSTAGGFIGELVSGSITTAYAEGNVLANSNVGGFVGTNRGTISNAYSTGRVHGNNRGGFVGSNNGTMSGNVYNMDLEIGAAGTGSGSGITAKTFVEMQNQSVMQGLGFTADKGWKYISNLVAPVLNGVGKIDDDGVVYVKELSEFKAGDTYYLNDAADLQKLAALVNAGADTTGVTFVLQNDIDMSGVNFAGIGGANNTSFKGDFYGNGHKIKNLTVNTTSNADIQNTGLFGYLEGAHIQDLAITNANIKGSSNIGILAGYADNNTTIDNVYTTGSVVGSSDMVGGFVGYSYATISESYSTANVTGRSSVGGFVGENVGSISKSYSTGLVNGTSMTGGFVGANSGGKIASSYSTSRVIGINSAIGGFVGYAQSGSNISNSYSTGYVEGNSTIGGFIGEVDSGVNISGNVFNSSTTLSAVGSGASTGITGMELKDMWDRSKMEAQGFTSDKGWKYNDKTTPYLNSNVSFTNGGKIYVNQINSFESGEVFYIANRADLDKLITLVNNGAVTEGVTFVLEADINAAGITSIGNTQDNAFEGIFYGSGYTISNLNTSLFGYIKDAQIRDVALENVNISTSGSYVGALVGYDSGESTISNVFVKGTISGGSYVGGLVGSLGQNSSITESYSEINVSGSSNIGGLVGQSSGTVYKSYADGNVTSTGSNAGGLIGNMQSGSVVDIAFAAGTVNGKTNVGGLVGNLDSGTISGSYSSGNVSGTSSVGAFLGRKNGGTTTDNVYNRQAYSTDASVGSTALTLDEMKKQSIMEELGFTSDKGWTYYEGKTPTLRQKDYSNHYEVDASLDTSFDRLGTGLVSKDITVEVNGNTYQKYFNNGDTVEDLINWLNNINGIEAEFDENTSQLIISSDSADLSVTGGLANMVFGGLASITTTTITQNTDSTHLMAQSSDEKITAATTISELLKSNNSASIGYEDEAGNIVMETFEADQTLADVMAYLESKGFDVTIENGIFTAIKNDGSRTDLYGAIGSALKGSNGTTTYNPSGYVSENLSSSNSYVANGTTKLEELGISSGNIHIQDSSGNVISSITIDNQMSINEVSSLLAGYGFILNIQNGKVSVTADGSNKLIDGTSDMVSKMKLDNWVSNKDKLTNSSTVEEMGFSSGASLGVVVSGKIMPDLSFTENDTLDTIIAKLRSYGINASVDSNGKFTASADFSFVLTGELGIYLTKNSINGYEQISNGYKSENPLEFSSSSVKLTEDTLIGELLGTGEGGILRLTIDENTVYDLKYNANDRVQDIIADLAAYGIDVKINDGVLTATSLNKVFRLSGDIGDALSGRTPKYEDMSTGYLSKDLSYETTGTAKIDSSMKELGILAGEIHILDNNGDILKTLSVDDTFTVSQIKSMLSPYGFNMTIDSNGKVSVTSNQGYILADGTSNMVSKMGLKNWNKTTEKLNLDTTISEMGFKDGADLNLFLDGLTQNILSFDANQTLQDIIFALSAYGINASVDANGHFTAESTNHTFVMSGTLGSFLTKGTTGYINRDTGYMTYKPLEEEKQYVEMSSDNLDYDKLMTADSTLSSLGFANGGNVIVMLDDNTSYTLSFLSTDTVQDVIYALSAYGINASVDSNGNFVAEALNNQFTMIGNVGSFLVSGGNYYNETTGYVSSALNYDTVEKVTGDTKLSDLGISKGDINILKDGNPFATINITEDTTVNQLFSGIKIYGLNGEIKTDEAGNTYIQISSNSNIKLADGTSNVVSGLNLVDIRQGDYEGNVVYWEDDAQSGLITGDMKLSDFDKNGFIAQGSLIVETGTGENAVEHIINITEDETINSLLKKFNDSGISASLENGIIKIHSGIDGINFKGGTSGLLNTLSLDMEDVDIYASSNSALHYTGEVNYSAANFADATTKLKTVNATDGQMSIYIDGIKATIQINSEDTFGDLFAQISAITYARSGVAVKAGFLDKDGNIVANPTLDNNTGIIAFEVEEGHELVIGSSIDTTNFATIANLNKSDFNKVSGSRSLYKVNTDSLITESGLYRAGDITEGTFKIGDAEFTIDSTTTLNDLMNQINKSEKAYATAYWDTLSGTMVIQSTLTGASLINIEAGTSNFTDIMGFTTQIDGENALVTDSQTLGKNAVIKINGTTITSTSNVITSDISKIKGLTINLKDLSRGETVTISVEQDNESIYNAVSETLDAYNQMMEALDKELADRNSLGSDPLLKLIRNQLKRLMTSSLMGDYVYKNLAAIGISTGEAQDSVSTNVTNLLIDKDTFMSALELDSDAVKKLLVGTKTNPGIFLQANNIVESTVNANGYFTNLANSLTRSINKTQQKITETNQDIENYKKRLERNFQNMESVISGMQNSYSNFLNKIMS